jgi:hypothetical protein
MYASHLHPSSHRSTQAGPYRRGQLNSIPVEGSGNAGGTRQEDTGLHAPAAVRPVDEAAVWTQLTKTWHMRFESERVRLLAMVPGALLDAADEHVNWRMSRVPWNFGGGPFDRQAAFTVSSLQAAPTFPLKCASSAARSFGRCRWPLTRRNW